MIPWPFNAPGRCPYLNSPDPKLKKEHEGHKTHLDCYHQTWIEPPLPWFKGGPPRFRCFHLAIGIRRDSGLPQTFCNMAPGPGPDEWRAVPVLNWHEEPGVWFCRKCIAEWTRGDIDVSVRDGVKMTKGQLQQLISAIEGTDSMEVEIRPTSIDDHPALIAEYQTSERNETYTHRLLVAGDGVVRLS